MTNAEGTKIGSVTGARTSNSRPSLESGRGLSRPKPGESAEASRLSEFGKRLNPRRENPKSFVELGIDAFQTVLGYARQQIVDPMKSLGRFVGLGLAGAVVGALGIVLGLFGLLRLLQTETEPFLNGATSRWLSFAPYLVVIIVGASIVGFIFSRISKDNARKQVR